LPGHAGGLGPSVSKAHPGKLSLARTTAPGCLRGHHGHAQARHACNSRPPSRSTDSPGLPRLQSPRFLRRKGSGPQARTGCDAAAKTEILVRRSWKSAVELSLNESCGVCLAGNKEGLVIQILEVLKGTGRAIKPAHSKSERSCIG